MYNIHTQSKNTNSTIKIMEIKHDGKTFSYGNILHRRLFKMLCMAVDGSERPWEHVYSISVVVSLALVNFFTFHHYSDFISTISL